MQGGLGNTANLAQAVCAPLADVKDHCWLLKVSWPMLPCLQSLMASCKPSGQTLAIQCEPMLATEGQLANAALPTLSTGLPMALR